MIIPHVPAIAGGFIVLVTLIYAIARWRNAPAAFKAIVWIAAANLVAGALVGFWTARSLDRSTDTDASRRVTVSGGESTVPSVGVAPTVVAPGSTPTAASSTHVSAAGPPSGILASYVGPALRWSGLNVTVPNGSESWDSVHKGCQLGNYRPTSALCRAARLAAGGGWSGTSSIPFRDIAEFCSAGYLEQARALCWWAQHGRLTSGALSTVAERVPGKDAGGIPEADVAEELAGWALSSGPHDTIVHWPDVKSSCIRGTYPLASPLCQADAIRESGGHSSARVAYPIVASFCDVGLIRYSSEVCRAAYRSVGIGE